MQANESEDGRVERLLAVFNNCDAALLPSFYEALKASGQEEVVSLLQDVNSNVTSFQNLI